MQILTLGLNHDSAPLPVRERVAFAGEQLGQAITDLREALKRVVPESAIISTCNRTEIYCAAPASAPASEAVAEWLSSRQGLPREALDAHGYLLPGRDAVRHAFRVASGLDSMVLGEPQILGQIKEAVRVAHRAGGLGSNLHQLFQRSFSVAKEVRTGTHVGAHSVSLAAAAVRLSRRIFDTLADSEVLFVGAGEMIELVATHFAAQQPKRIVVANRTALRAEALAHRLGADTLPLADLPEHLHRFDVVVSCTASSLPIIGLGMVEKAVRARRRRPVFMVDLAVPRDIEAEVARLDDVFLHTVDDLGRVVSAGMEGRRAAVAQAEAIIETRTDAFMHWLKAREAVPSILRLNERANAIREHEIARARRALAHGESPEAVLESLAQALSAKFLHGPMTLLGGSEEKRAHITALLDDLLPGDPEDTARHS